LCAILGSAGGFRGRIFRAIAVVVYTTTGERTIMKKSVIVFASGLAAMIGSLTANAGEPLSAAALKALISGRTAHAEHLKRGFTFKAYFKENGEYIRYKDGSTNEGNWRIEDDGSHCVDWGYNERCATMEDNGDGTYTRVLKNGKRIIRWNKLVDGRDF
jgi:hypothetical protein